MGRPVKIGYMYCSRSKGTCLNSTYSPRNSPYQMQKITRLTPEERLQMQEQIKGPTTKQNATSKEIPKPEQPTLQGKQQGAGRTEDPEPDTVDRFAKSTNKNKPKRKPDDAGSENPTQDAQAIGRTNEKGRHQQEEGRKAFIRKRLRRRTRTELR